jgi:hypothetical protein
MDELKKVDLQKHINAENGINYHKNVNLKGYIPYRGESFIAFRLMEVNNNTIVVVDYIYMTDKESLVQLMSWCVNFWTGNAVKYVYYKEHRRKATVVKMLKSLGFTVKDIDYHGWKHDWTSTNGYSEEDVIEAHT